ncbi:LysR family transcriptional regulator [Tomitella fengzijianii]|uniref:LysR family transcriptional regulator n=1 Tax=Tomitella fengzijianii TaxID=2597660 RepID=A0A516X838_9ACTN|nr:LysR family transcriptional regulator [Tomitella fengzijianii]
METGAPGGSTPDSPAGPRFRLAFVPGATPGKWARVWEARFPDVPLDLAPADTGPAVQSVRAGEADAALVRLPIDREGLHVIPLYTEATVVVMPKDHVLTLDESLTPDDLADEIVHHPLDDVLDWNSPPGIPSYQRPETTQDALDLVLAGVGLVALPQSLARLLHRKGLVHRPLEEDANPVPDLVSGPGDAGGAPGDDRGRIAHSPVALVWREDRSTELMDEFIGIVRGRTANSSRGTGGRAQRARDDTGGKGSTGGTGSAGRKKTGGGKAAAGGAKSGGGKRATGPRRGRPAGRPKRGRPRGRR